MDINVIPEFSAKKQRICELLLKGLSYKEIVQKLHCSKSTITFHAKRLGLGNGNRAKYDWEAIQKYHNLGYSRRECMEKFGFSKQTWSLAVRTKRIKPQDWMIPLDELLVIGRRTSRNHLKNRLIKEKLFQYVCYECGISMWRQKFLSLELDHKNGNKYDNRLENLCLLCPNCHSQTPTYGGRNKGKHLPSGVIGNTSRSGREVSRFES